MKRGLVLALIIGMFLVAAVIPASATPVGELTALASYFPEDTPVFIGFRTDDAFIDEIDDLVARVAEALPPRERPETTLRETLEAGVKDGFGRGATFANTVRSWLGDTGAVGVLALSDFEMDRFGSEDMPALVALSITDRAAAERFIERMFDIGNAEFEKTRERGATVYIPEYGDSVTAVTDDALFIASSEELLPLNADFLALDDSANFGDTTAMLPEADYSAILYLNVGTALVGMMEQTMAAIDEPGTEELFEGFMPFYENFPTQAIGFTVLDGRSLTMDLAQSAFDFSVLEGTFMGNVDIEALLSAPPIDTAFAGRVPADAAFFIQGTNFGAALNYVIDVVGYSAEIAMQTTMQMMDSIDHDRMPRFASELSASDIRAFFDLAFAGLTGMNLEDEFLAQLNGNSAFYARILPDELLRFTLDTALVFEATDAEGMQNIYDKLQNALTRYEVTFSEEGNALVLPNLIRQFFPRRFPEEMLESPALDFLIGYDGEAMAFGTRQGVEFSLDPADGSIADDPTYVAASAYFLPGANQLWYLNFDQLETLAGQFADLMPGRMGRNAAETQDVLAALDSASITSVMNEDGSSLGRFVVTLAE